MYIWACSFVLKGLDNGPSPVVHALPSEARHGRSEASRFVKASCTYHRLYHAHSTDFIPHVDIAKQMGDCHIYIYLYTCIYMYI